MNTTKELALTKKKIQGQASSNFHSFLATSLTNNNNDSPKHYKVLVDSYKLCPI